MRWPWGDHDNNKAFLAQAIVMTLNASLSILNALKRERPEDDYKNAVTIEWPLGPHGEAFPIGGYVVPAVVFKGGTTSPLLRSSCVSSWPMAGSLTIWTSRVSASCRRSRAPLPAILARPERPHRDGFGDAGRARGRWPTRTTGSGNWRHGSSSGSTSGRARSIASRPMASAPAQAVDEAIDRIKQILS